MRDPNAIDFWRGFALVTIFINHIPGNTFERYTFSQYGISDAAELFVFLAGWSIGIATRGRDGVPEPAGKSVVRLLNRTVEVYRAQLTVMLMALAIIAGAALLLDNPLILEWHNAGGFFADPIQSVCGMVLLTYQLGYFNILPLYVLLIGVAPLFVLVGRYSLVGTLILSGGIYLASLVFEWNLPSWPGEGDWYFDPFCWQVLLVLGFLLQRWNARSDFVRRWARRLFPAGIVIVLAGIVLAVTEIRPDPMLVPEPRLLFTFEKTYLTPARLVHFLGVLLAFAPVYALLAPRIGSIVGYLTQLGRNSLAVFSMGSILSLIGQLVRFQTGGGLLIDMLVAGSGLIGLGLTAWFVEWRTRSKAPRLRP
ncbi:MULTISPECIES: OpgC domain-containing protein [unclassified Methylobacterium]|uniref:OpgC family protein n=1 Tax=unclassified Methylobacterium TaxID=2615210 RepID=UPI00226ADC99|nr:MULTISPECIES: OpgC domain-containing protein [unclassified Methylobacterium]